MREVLSSSPVLSSPPRLVVVPPSCRRPPVLSTFPPWRIRKPYIRKPCSRIGSDSYSATLGLRINYIFNLCLACCYQVYNKIYIKRTQNGSRTIPDHFIFDSEQNGQNRLSKRAESNKTNKIRKPSNTSSKNTPLSKHATLYHEQAKPYYQNDHTDRGIISWFRSKTRFTIVIISKHAAFIPLT
jgi:hypothetical protein